MKPSTGIKIPLANNVWLTSDTLNFRLSKLTKVEGVGDSWNHIGFYSTIGHALTDAHRMGLRSSEATSLKELEKESQRILSEISKHFDLIIEGVK